MPLLRTGLAPEGAARWANRLQEQTEGVLADADEEELNGLIGHPVFLDALCGIIESYPSDERIAAADKFEVTSTDVFGQILNRILERERGKAIDQWAKLEGKLEGDWDDPFAADRQLRVFEEIVLRVARDGGGEALRRSTSDMRFGLLRHGLFTFTSGISPAGDSSTAALRQLLRDILGEPTVSDAVSADDADKVASEALDEVVAFFRQHTLIDTGPDNPDELVIAMRHRAYFDYLLGQALIQRLRRALSSQNGSGREEFVFWCLEHHIFERREGADGDPPFASCLDFVTWDRERLSEAFELIDHMFLAESSPDALLASYVASLALAVLLRATSPDAPPVIQDRRFEVASDDGLELVSNVVPAVSNVQILRCSIPKLVLPEINLHGVVLEEDDIDDMVLRDASLAGVRFEDTAIAVVALVGKISITNSHLDFAPDTFDYRRASDVTIRSSSVSPELKRLLDDAVALRPDCFTLSDLDVIEPPETPADVTPGQFFINKLCSLTRRHGHDEFAVFGPKLRGRSRATGETFPAALHVLEKHDVINRNGDMLYLTRDAEQHRYDGKERPGNRTFADVAEYWDPVVRDLDKVL